MSGTENGALPLPPALRKLAQEWEPERDGLGRSEAAVYRMGSCYVKTGPAGSLERAARMQALFARLGLSQPLRLYETWQGRDYLAVDALEGKDGTRWLDRPEWLAEQMGRAARALHRLDAGLCPLRDVNQRAEALYRREKGEACPGAELLRVDAIVHGDFCLPNVFFDEKGPTGFIDLGEGGAGDRHFDLYLGMWSLAYNLKTDRWNGRFLDAYGRDRVDEARLAVCAKMSEI